MNRAHHCIDVPLRGYKRGNMQRVNDFWFYQLGYNVHRLFDLKEGDTIGDIFLTLKAASNWLEAMMDDSEIFRFRVAVQSAANLRTHIDQFFTEPMDFARPLTSHEAGRFVTLARELETVMAAEVATFHTYYVTKKLAYDTQALTSEGESLLPNGIRSKVPPEAIEDLREAAKCIAFEVNTASAFHTIRATESVIRIYYWHVVGSLPKVKDRNWGSYIRVLRTKGADARVTGFLDHIRESYRNPITHPEHRLNPEEAQVLLGVCVSAIIQLVGAIDAIQATDLAQNQQFAAAIAAL